VQRVQQRQPGLVEVIERRRVRLEERDDAIDGVTGSGHGEVADLSGGEHGAQIARSVRSSQGVSLASLDVPNLRPMARAGDGHDVGIRSIVLDALIAGRPIDDIVDLLSPHHEHGSTSPASVLMELAADAYLARSSRRDPLAVDGLAERMLPEDPARGNVGHSKRRHCAQRAIMIAAGAEPEDTRWWSIDDLWRHALDAVIVFVRAAAERRTTTVEHVCKSLTPG